MWYRALAVLFFVALLSGCLSRQEEGPNLVRQAGWQWEVIHGGQFDLATAHPPVTKPAKTLWIYIEGDGLAYVTPARVSSDPTPTTATGLQLSLADPHKDSVAYIARPCQFIMNEYGRNCGKEFWTNMRYSHEVVISLNMAVDQLKKKFGAEHIIMAGYSGGGALAVLVAAKRNDVTGIVTVAANLDVTYWTQTEKLTPLTSSLDPSNFTHLVNTIPQIHFAGKEDDVVPPNTAKAFASRLPANSPVKVIEIPGFNHSCCWVQKWNELISSNNPETLSGN